MSHSTHNSLVILEKTECTATDNQNTSKQSTTHPKHKSKVEKLP